MASRPASGPRDLHALLSPCILDLFIGKALYLLAGLRGGDGARGE